MSLHVLSDGDVRSLLASLDAAALEDLFSALGDALQAYSVGDEKQYQCHRQGVTRPGGPTMLFMPATLADGVSVKVVGVPLPAPASMPVSSPSPSPSPSTPKGLTGVVLICDQDGRAIGLLNAAALTAFRTALGSILLYRHRATTARIVVFGAGKQALWHIRLALVLRRADIAAVTIVNRSAARAAELVAELRAMDEAQQGSADATLHHVAFRVLSPEAADVEAVREAVQQADVVFCTTPSTSPVFPAAWLTGAAVEGKPKTRFISAIGSYKLDMQELDPVLLHTIATDDIFPASYRPPTAIDVTGSTIVVDSRDACAVEAGELVKADLPDGHLLETGELLHMRSTLSALEDRQLAAWLCDGNVVYKSVGIGIMDLSIGRALLELGAARGVGTTIAHF
ncbi:shikimate 5-dehydrogenase [Grosmannia clavigera kw1407]|uniref:Shikimate 5-dehydrogenase n=1 Tax=Grosmannia clavigera (strain kw1407 / UAMH 11150) TaxID=655863 RepID=F0X6N0_GROCL|nr:shikimate 5-dehydrogenase [Grosmannia clavigera kw1407]EFX06687.1 shikimate 5-dehydrogenase [Grosmannia clavigera kw1407]